MKSDIKELWVKALTDGSYEQGTNALKVDNQFCCLGVLCDLHAKATGNDWKVIDGNYFYLDNEELLPEKVMEWAGLNSQCPQVETEDQDLETDDAWYKSIETLADLNDSGSSFEEIAQLIKEQL